LAKRLANAEMEIELANKCGLFTRIFVNDDQARFVQETITYIVKDLYELE
jgi:guanylate kinase